MYNSRCNEITYDPIGAAGRYFCRYSREQNAVNIRGDHQLVHQLDRDGKVIHTVWLTIAIDAPARDSLDPTSRFRKRLVYKSYS